MIYRKGLIMTSAQKKVKTFKKPSAQEEAAQAVQAPQEVEETPTVGDQVVQPVPQTTPVENPQPAVEPAFAKSDLAGAKSDLASPSLGVASPVVEPASSSKEPVSTTLQQGEPTEPVQAVQENETNEMNKDINPSGKKNFLLPIIFVVLLAVSFYGGIFVYKKFLNKNENATPNIVTLSVTPTRPAPTPTSAEVDLSKYEIKILNGSEAAGEAGRQKDDLETEGFTVTSIGNAETSDYTNTVIQAKKEVDENFLEELKKVLEKSFTLSSSTKELEDDASTAVVVILGVKK